MSTDAGRTLREEFVEQTVTSAASEVFVIVRKSLFVITLGAAVLYGALRGASGADLTSAPVVKVPKGYTFAQLAGLRGDQLIETPSGRRVTVAKLRAIHDAFAAARAKDASHPEGRFIVTRAPAQPCQEQLQSGESGTAILARPTTLIVCVRPGAGVSVAQLRAMAPMIRSGRYGALASTAGTEVRVTSAAQLRAQLRTASDSTVIVTPKGNRSTVRELREYVRMHPQSGISGGAR